MRGKVFALLMALALIVAAGTAQAEIMDVLPVTAVQGGACSMLVTPVDFGTVPLSNDNFANGDIEVNCTDLMPYQITLDNGVNIPLMMPPRMMMDAGMTVSVPYILFQDAGYSMEWGDNAVTYPFPSFSDSGMGIPQSHPVYGVQLGTLGVPDGTSVSDMVGVTVWY